MESRKDSIRKKYNLEDFEGRLNNSLQLMENTNFVMLVEGCDLPTCGNLSNYSKNINDIGVLCYMKNLKSDYNPTVGDFYEK